MKFYNIIITILLVSSSCSDKQAKKQVILEKYPQELIKIIHNNKKIPSFKSKFNLKIDAINLDGTINKNNKLKTITFSLKNALRNKNIIDGTITKENAQIYISTDDYDKIITGKINEIKLEEHFENFKVKLKTIINILALKIFIIEKADKIIKQISKSKTLFLLEKTKDKEKQIIEIDKQNNYIKQTSFFKNNNALFSIEYKKYKTYKNFFFPKRIDLFHKETNSELIIFMTNTQFEKDNIRKPLTIKDDD